MFAYFCFRLIFKTIFTPVNFSIIHSRPAQIINGALSDSCYWLNSKVAVPLEGITVS